ncbi:MAG TPA: condensation domain-containing protein, partial [Kofleriaceae bacterium]|nr:condensation domain-containing protein [Kofleriaceae bacterium]
TTLPALPLTSSGKIDRNALPAPALDGGASSATEHAPPRTPIEHALVQIWAEVLGRAPDTVSIHDDFFALGGHSLRAVQIVSRIRDRLGAELALRAVFEAPTVAALAPRVAAAAGDHLPPIAPMPRDQPLPLSLAQQRIWFLHQLDAQSGAYHMPLALRLRGDLDTAALQHALTAMVDRHELLRTSFPERDGRPVQHIHDAASVPLPVADLSDLAPELRLAEARRLAADDAAHPFDLAHGPLVRAQLVRLADDDHVLLVCLHHLVADGGSLPILVREIAAGYDHARTGGGDGPIPGLAPLAMQFADIAAWQHQHLVPRLDPELAYWRDALAGAPAALELPTDRPRPATQSFAGATVLFSIEPALARAVEALGHQHGATLFMVLQSAWAVLLARHSRQDHVVVGAPVANRSRAALEPLIGMFVNTLALHNDLSGRPGFAEVLRRGRAMVLGAFDHQDLPFEQLVEALQPVRDMSRNPVFQAAFTLDHEPAAPPALPGLQLVPLHDGADLGPQIAKFDLDLHLTTRSGGLEATLLYSTALFDRITIERMARQFTALLAAAVAAPDMPVHALELSDADERALLAAWSATAAELPGTDDCLHELIAQQAARTPDHVAVVFEDQQLTYAELLARAHQLAHHLQQLGVGPDDVVAVLLERSLDLPVALLGILAAGAAYLPLDPDHPAERLAFAVRDAGAPLLVTCHALAGKLAGPLADHPARVVCLDGSWPATDPGDPPAPLARPEHLAYVLYTSGSTGTPKGVPITHRALVSFLRAMMRTVALEPRDAILAVTTVAFDIAALELFQPLVSGARLVLADGRQAADAAELRHLIDRHAITVLQATPATWRMLVNAGWQGAPGLRMLCGGEALPARLAAELRLRGRALWNVYGSTE